MYTFTIKCSNYHNYNFKGVNLNVKQFGNEMGSNL